MTGSLRRDKRKLISAPTLGHYNADVATKVETDASNDTIAGVLLQEDSKQKWHPVSYYLQTMSMTKRNNLIHDKELLAIVRALGKWRSELVGLQSNKRFGIYTYHRALEYFMAKNSSTLGKLNGPNSCLASISSSNTNPEKRTYQPTYSPAEMDLQVLIEKASCSHQIHSILKFINQLMSIASIPISHSFTKLYN